MRDELLVQLSCPFCGETRVLFRELPYKSYGNGEEQETLEITCCNCYADIRMVARKKGIPDGSSTS